MVLCVDGGGLDCKRIAWGERLDFEKQLIAIPVNLSELKEHHMPDLMVTRIIRTRRVSISSTATAEWFTSDSDGEDFEAVQQEPDQPGLDFLLNAIDYCDLSARVRRGGRASIPLAPEEVGLIYSAGVAMLDAALLAKLLAKAKEKGGDIDTPNAHGETALHIAVELEKQEMVALLLAAGASPNSRFGNRLTPFQLSVDKLEAQFKPEKKTIFRMLYQHGGDPFLRKAQTSETAFELAHLHWPARWGAWCHAFPDIFTSDVRELARRSLQETRPQREPRAHEQANRRPEFALQEWSEPTAVEGRRRQYLHGKPLPASIGPADLQPR